MNEVTQKILEMCADHLGLTSILAHELSINSEQLNALMEKFVKEGSITKENETQDPFCRDMSAQYWYMLTSKGKSILI